MRIDLAILVVFSLLGIAGLTAAVASELLPPAAKPAERTAAVDPTAALPKKTATAAQPSQRAEAAHRTMGGFVPLATMPVVEVQKPGAWNGACAKDKCLATAELALPDNGGKVRMWVTRLPGSTAIGALVPLGFHLPSAIGLSLDDGKTVATQLKFVDCSVEGCRAVGELSSALESKLAAVDVLMLTMKEAKSQAPVGLRMPMSGFSQSVTLLK